MRVNLNRQYIQSCSARAGVGCLLVVICGCGPAEPQGTLGDPNVKLSYDKDGNPIAPNTPKMNMGGKVEKDDKGSAVLKKGVSPGEAKPGAENIAKQASEDKSGAPNPADDKSATDSKKVEKK